MNHPPPLYTLPYEARRILNVDAPQYRYAIDWKGDIWSACIPGRATGYSDRWQKRSRTKDGDRFGRQIFYISIREDFYEVGDLLLTAFGYKPQGDQTQVVYTCPGDLPAFDLSTIRRGSTAEINANKSRDKKIRREVLKQKRQINKQITAIRERLISQGHEPQRAFYSDTLEDLKRSLQEYELMQRRSEMSFGMPIDINKPLFDQEGLEL